jgi:hypothetical protein
MVSELTDELKKAPSEQEQMGMRGETETTGGVCVAERSVPRKQCGLLATWSLASSKQNHYKQKHNFKW